MSQGDELLSGQTVSVHSRYTRKVYAQREGRTMRKNWSDRVMEGDDHLGVITEGEIATYIGSNTHEELDYDPKGEFNVQHNLYHLIMWRGNFVWVDDRKGYLLPA